MEKKENKKLKYIGVKDVGSLALPDFCPRCFWFERHFGPFPSPFPGIFNVIDKAAKEIVYKKFLASKELPSWLEIKDVVGLPSLEEIGTVEISQQRKYLVALHKKSGWILRGSPDRVFKLKDDTLHIIDFKTARFTEAQDSLFPLYEVQLNGYALLAYKMPISKLSLVYCEPKYDAEKESFYLEFVPKIVNVGINKSIISDLLIKAREIVDLKIPPKGKEGCRGTCYYIDRINSSVSFF
jgi:hypothetical protein